MKTTLAKALVVKSRLIQELTKVRSRIQTSNTASVQYTSKDTPPTGPKWKHPIKDLIKEEEETTLKLLKTKTAISLANKDEQQQRRIFALSELKAQIVMFQGMGCDESREIGGGRYGTSEGVITQTFAQMPEATRDEIVKRLQTKIDSTQEEMEKFNWATEVELPD